MISLFLTCFDLFFISSTFGAYRTYYNFQHVLNETRTFVKQVKVPELRELTNIRTFEVASPVASAALAL